MLNIQYRMNELILKWSNSAFYKNKLLSDESCKSITVSNLLCDIGEGSIKTENFKTESVKTENFKTESVKTESGSTRIGTRGKILNNKKGKTCKNRSKDKDTMKREKRKESVDDTDVDSENKKKNTNHQDLIKSYSYCPLTWIETDGFDDFLDDTKDIDMIQLELKDKKDEKQKEEQSNDTSVRKSNLQNGCTGSDSSNSNTSKKKQNSEKKATDRELGAMVIKPTDEELEAMVKINVNDIINLSNKSRSNKGEAYLIYKLIEKIIIIDKINESNICIITPYTKQVNILRSIFYDNIYNLKNYKSSFKNIEIATVDSFQGREKEIVILSLVCSNYFKNIGFLNDYRRLNVAITRAKRNVTIVGNSNTISSDKVLNKLYETALNYGKVYLVNELIDVDNMLIINT
uniref:DNA2/NAM7 helicase-like C-terminal domain-containing protein n=1 Tax=Piliocolobus tephrosceles TaxID=591936 RepID=A0A8C9HFC2_9PRIM